MSTMDLYKGDCLAVMDELIAKGVVVDAIITDPPYGTIKGMVLKGQDEETTKWDTEIDFDELNKRFIRLLKEKGALVLFGQEPFTSKMIQNADKNIPFSYRKVWVKDHFANPLASKKAPVNYFEDIMVFFKKYDIYNQNPLRVYFKKVIDFIGLSLKQINAKLGHRKAEHTFYIESIQFKICTESVYDELISVFKIDTMEGFKNYIDIKNQNNKFEPTFNLEGENKKSNVLEFRKEYNTQHPTQKPITLMEYLIRTYTNEGELVLDFTMGSGTTGVACKKLNRNFIGIERCVDYFDISQKRIENTELSIDEMSEW